jgi:aldehyde oxidase
MALFISGLTLGAGLSLAQVKDILAEVVQKLPDEKTQTYCALLKHLRTLAGQQIRSMAVCFDTVNSVCSH